MVWRAGRPNGRPSAADGRTRHRRSRSRAVRAARHRRVVLDDVLPRRGGARIRDGGHGCALDDDGDGRRRSSTCGRRVRRQQCGGAGSGTRGDCRLWRDARANFRGAGAPAAGIACASTIGRHRPRTRTAEDGRRRCFAIVFSTARPAESGPSSGRRRRGATRTRPAARSGREAERPTRPSNRAGA